ncbi:ATP-binding protein [Streptomyces sp. NPDC127118]|uniref:ATP-binding protein n=1 Tax=Streptomyces sp. NPDC127118 TaxID=3345369 RepID=UPI00362AEF54
MSPLPIAVDLLAVPKAVPEMRRTLRERCEGVDSPDLLLCVSELLTNVIVHLGEGTPVTLRGSGTRTGRVRVELSDPEPCAWPTLRTAAGGDESGRGLVLVDALALRWGIEQRPYGKTVWCELRAPGPLLAEGRAGEGGQRRVSGVSESTRVSFSGLRT